MQTIADLFARHRKLVGWFLLALTMLSAWGYIKPANSRHPLEKYEEQRQQAATSAYGEVVESQFDLSRSDAFLVVEVDDLFTPEAVTALREMVDAVETLPIVESVFWVDRVPVLNVFGLADPLLPPNDGSETSFKQSRETLLSHPLAQQLISDDGKSLLMPVVYDWLQIQESKDTVDPLLQAARGAIRKSVGGTSAQTAGNAMPPGYRVRLTGGAPLFVAQQSAFDRNQLTFQAIGYTLAFILASFMFRGAAAVLVVSIAPALGVFWAIGLINLFGIPSNPLATVVMPVMVSMIGLTDGVHLLVFIRRQRQAGDSPLEAARLSIEKVGLACWLTSLTTAIGFGSLLLAKDESNYVQDFGRVCGFGVLVAFVAVVTFVPWISSTWIGKYIHRGQERDVMSRGVDRLGSIINVMLRHRKIVAVLSVAVTLGLAALSFTLKPDNRIATAMPSSSEAYQSLAHADQAFGGISFFQVDIDWQEQIDSDDPEVLAAIRAAEEIVKQEPLLSRPLSIRNLLATFPGDPEDLATQVTFLSLLPRDLSGFFYQYEDRKAVISIRMQDLGIAKYTPVFDRMDDEFGRLAEQYPGFTFKLSGQPVQISRDLFQIVSDLKTSLGTASVIILFVLAIVYRSVRIGLISVVPNLFPLAATGGLLVALGQTLDMASVCAFVVCLGIAVDDTIHFLSRFKQELEIDGDVPNAIRRAFVGVGSALLMTTVILVSGFATMLMSDLPGHRTFAAMACTTITAAVVGDLIALPALLSCFYKPKASDFG